MMFVRVYMYNIRKPHRLCDYSLYLGRRCFFIIIIIINIYLCLYNYIFLSLYVRAESIVEPSMRSATGNKTRVIVNYIFYYIIIT